MTIVEVCSPLYGDLLAVAHELSATEAVVEMGYLPPVGTELTLRIGEAGEMALRAVVIGHVREQPARPRGEPLTPEQIDQAVARYRSNVTAYRVGALTSDERRLVRMRLVHPVDATSDDRASVH